MTTQTFFTRMRHSLLALGSLLLIDAGTAALALTVEVEGTAPISDGAPGKARVMAVQNALQQAAMQYSVSISASTTMNNGTVTGDSARMRTTARITNATVADEWQEDGVYHVLVRADVDNNNGTGNGPDGARRRVAFLQATLRDRGAASDLPTVEIELPRMLRKEVERSLGAIGVDASQYLLGNGNQSETPEPGIVMRTAQDLGVQFLVTMDIIDTGITDDMVGQSRRIEIEFVVYDGVSGTVLSRSRFDEHVIGTDRLKSGVSVASKEFQNSPYGKSMKQIVQHAADKISADVGQLPFTANIVRTNGKKVFIDAGSAARMRVGDMLLAFRVESTSTNDPKSGRSLGNAEQPIATLVIRTVQPQFSIGEVETDQVTLKPGDLVRFAW